jgi:hypothetical protein
MKYDWFGTAVYNSTSIESYTLCNITHIDMDRNYGWIE